MIRQEHHAAHADEPLQRPYELACAILLTASSAGSFLTGANVVVDGGFTTMTI